MERDLLIVDQLLSQIKVTLIEGKAVSSVLLESIQRSYNNRQSSSVEEFMRELFKTKVSRHFRVLKEM